MSAVEIAVGTRFELEIIRPAYGGDVLGYAPDGRVVFLRGAAPGDRAEVEVTARRRKFLKARLIRVIPGADREPPFCPHFSDCGGCPWQAVPRETQQKALSSAIERSIIGQCERTPEVVSMWSGSGVGWRSTTRLHWHGSRIGYFKPGSHTLVDIPECLILASPLTAMLTAVREAFRSLHGSGIIKLTGAPDTASGTVVVQLEEAEDSNAVRSALQRLLQQPCFHGAILEQAGRPAVMMGEPSNLMGPDRVVHMANSFVQAHQAGSAQLVVDAVAATDGAQRILELYAGSGNFTFALANRGADVTAVEIDSAAVARLNSEVTRRGVAHKVRAICSRAEDINTVGFDTIVLDPPRTGARAVLELIAGSTAKRLVYISCDQATLARDLTWLRKRGWHLAKIRAYDVFPHTGHVEVLAICERVSERTER